VLTRQEREKLVIDLYNQGMTIRDIAREVRISFRDIGLILKKASGEKEEKQDNEQSLLSPSSQAYRLFLEGKSLIDVAISLDLSESEVTKYYEEYLNLKQMYELRMVYKEIGGDIVPFLKLFRILKKERINSQHIVNLFSIANNDLPALERRYHRLKKDVVLLELKEQKSGSQVRILAKMSEDYKQQIEELREKKMAFESLIREFKNNKVYKKIRRIAEEEVNNRLSKNKELLTIAISSVLESISKDPTKYNFLVNSNQWHTLHSNFIDKYRSLILDDSQTLFEIMTRELTNKILENSILKHGPQPLIESSFRQNIQ
jgi:uncharacterized protein (UPF0147 family)